MSTVNMVFPFATKDHGTGRWTLNQ